MHTAASSITQDIAASTAFGRLRPTDTGCSYACAKRYDKLAAIVIDHPVGAAHRWPQRHRADGRIHPSERESYHYRT